MSEMAPEATILLCLVCSQPLPAEDRRGRPRKVCRDEDSPTPGGCYRWRDNDRRSSRRGGRSRVAFTPSDRKTLDATFGAVGHGFLIE